MDLEEDGDTNYNWCIWNDSRKPGKRVGRFENRRMSRDHLNYSITKIKQNTETSPGDLKRLAVSQTLGRNDQLPLVRQTHKE